MTQVEYMIKHNMSQICTFIRWKIAGSCTLLCTIWKRVRTWADLFPSLNIVPDSYTFTFSSYNGSIVESSGHWLLE